jgi:hypothetical protein
MSNESEGWIEPAPMPITMYALRLTEAGRRARYEAGFAGTVGGPAREVLPMHGAGVKGPTP